MSEVRMPYQCLEKCGNVLLAARGASIDSFSLEKGSLLSTWTCPSTQGLANANPAPQEVAPTVATQASESSSVDIAIDATSPPAKRRKLSSAGQDGQRGEPKQEKKKQNNRSDAVASGLEAPAVIAFATTKGGEHVIAVTGEDKSIRVFENVLEGGKHQLKQTSLRAMPKRPCAITITPDNNTIISADKFGDVYSLPLIPSQTSSFPKSETPEPPTTSKPFTPAANELTIHSQRNRKALENQRRQTNKPSEKPESVFEHQLLLGHVSMLTDVALASVGGRNYILTADRDEHIRVSRGIPHTHVVEGFCLGHAEFVTRLCIPSGREGMLVSGGGDDELFVWEWQAGRLVSKVNLKSHVVSVMQNLGSGEETSGAAESMKITVSGIIHIPQPTADGVQDMVFVACEGVPALFTFTLNSENNLVPSQTLPMAGNVLDVLADIPRKQARALNRIIVSVDTIHRPGSTTECRGSTEERLERLQIFEIQDGKLMEVKDFMFAEAEEHEGSVSLNGAEGRLTNLLYNLENLRKREEDNKEE